MQAWLPVPGTTTGRLVNAALQLFGSRGFAAVGVAEIARAAGVTTGALYHHFGSKTGLWNLVRGDVEQRVIDRIEGAAAISMPHRLADLAPAVLVGFDYLVRTDYARLLAEPPHPDAGPDGDGDDRVSALIDRLLEGTGPAVGELVAAAWRSALAGAASGPDAAVTARAGLERLLAGA